MTHLSELISTSAFTTKLTRALRSNKMRGLARFQRAIDERQRDQHKNAQRNAKVEEPVVTVGSRIEFQGRVKVVVNKEKGAADMCSTGINSAGREEFVKFDKSKHVTEADAAELMKHKSTRVRNEKRNQIFVVDEHSVAKAGIRHVCFTFSWQSVAESTFMRVSGAVIIFNKARELVGVVDARKDKREAFNGSIKHNETHSHTDSYHGSTTVHETTVVDTCHLPTTVHYLFFVICSTEGAQNIVSPSLECYDVRRAHLGPMSKINLFTPPSQPSRHNAPPPPPKKAPNFEDDSEQNSVSSFVLEHKFVPNKPKSPAPPQSIIMGLFSRVGDGFKLEPVCVRCPGHIDRMGALKRTLTEVVRHRTHTKKEAQVSAAKAAKPPPSNAQILAAMTWEPPASPSDTAQTDRIPMEELTMSSELTSMLWHIRQSLGLSKSMPAAAALDEAAAQLGLEIECDGLKTLRAKAGRIMEELDVRRSGSSSARRYGPVLLP
jgi:hypothetical protein